MTARGWREDVAIITNALKEMPVDWDGRRSILELKKNDYQWRQMEWLGFYFEFLCKKYLARVDFKIPGGKYGNVEFDSFRNINWDMKTSAITGKKGTGAIILNDKIATDKSLSDHGGHGIILARLDVECDDDNRKFQQWHNELKGGLSSYEKNRIKRNAGSRRRKTRGEVKQILGNNTDNLTNLSATVYYRHSNQKIHGKINDLQKEKGRCAVFV